MKLFLMLVFLLLSIGTCYAEIKIQVVNKIPENIRLIGNITQKYKHGKVEINNNNVILKPNQDITFSAEVSATDHKAGVISFKGELTISGVSPHSHRRAICQIRYTQAYSMFRGYTHDAMLQTNPDKLCGLKKKYDEKTGIFWRLTLEHKV